MSANTSIKEGGTPFPFGPVRAILVEGSDGKYDPWVPESERQLGYKSIDKNGIYRASDDGVYGWGSVSVSVSQATSVTGRDPDTGEEVVVRPDPETGDIVKTVVPVEIRVIEPPTNPYGTYVDGQTITKDGMVVKAYDALGVEMLTVPVGEITINPTTAAYDESKDEQASAYDETIQGNLRQPIPLSYTLTRIIETTDSITTREQTFSAGATTGLYLRSTGNSVGVLAASEDLASVIVTMHIHVDYKDGRSPYDTTTQTTYGLRQATVNGKTFYWGEVGGDGLDGVVESYTDIISGNAPNANDAYVLLYGEKTRAGSPQTITVSWPRPGDGAILETTFDILVGPHGGQGDD